MPHNKLNISGSQADFLSWVRRPMQVEESDSDRTDSERTVVDRNVTALATPRTPARIPAMSAGEILIRIGIALTLLALGLARELVGRGSLLNGAGALLGSWAQRLELKVFSVDMGFLLAMLPPGAFISLGLLIAARNWLARRPRTQS